MAFQLKFAFRVLALLIGAWTSIASAQTLFPTPEHQKIDYFAGDWKLEGTMKLSPTVPGGDFTATDYSEWVSGNFFLHTKSSMHSVMGDTRGVRVMEYNADDKVYTYDAYNSLGEHYTITVVSPVAYSFKYETLTGTGSWATVMEGKATRSQ